MLVIDQLYAGYNNRHVLRGVSVTVNRGEVVALLGRNGAGKTTTLNTVMGFVSIGRGTITVQNTSIARLKPHQIARLGVGFVPQGRAIFPTLTVKENITLAAKSPVRYGWTLDNVLALFPALAHRLKHLGTQLSGGEQQMLAIARALMLNPQLLLLDEPSEGLAPKLVTDLKHTIRRLRGEGLSILLVEQNSALALGAADKLYTMNKGKIVFSGSPDQLQQNSDILYAYPGI